MKPIFSFIISGCFFLFGCSSCEPSCHVSYEFEIPLQLYPKQDTFAVGDTIWIEASFSDTLRDFISGSSYFLPNFNFSTALHLKHLTKDTMLLGRQPGGFNSIDVWNVKGLVKDIVIEQAAHVYFDEKDHRNALTTAIILKDTGTFSLFLTFEELSYHAETDPIDVTTRCTEFVDDLRYTWGEPEENNYDMLLQNAELDYLYEPPTAYSDAFKHGLEHASFTFVVK